MNTNQYADLEIRIIRKQNADSVELTLNYEQQFGVGQLDLSTLVINPGATPEEQGQQLCDWLFSDEKLREHWAELRGRYPQRRIRLRIDADAPDLHALPWELLREVRDEQVALDLAAAESTPFSRYIAGSWLPGTPVFKRPLRVLVAIPCPANLDTLRLPTFNAAEEWTNLEQAVKGLQVELTELPAPCTLNALQSELRKGYHVLHLITHGLFAAEQSVIVMANDRNQAILIGEKEFSEMLARSLMTGQVDKENQLRLIYLDSCETAMRDFSDAFRGFAPALVKAGIPAVIAMQELIQVNVAQAFSATFYRQLLVHGQVDLACNQARSSLINARLPGAAIPVLFMRLRDGVLLGTHGRVSSRQDFWPFLIGNIEARQCIPILGPGVLNGLLPSREFIASQLAEKYDYPMSDVRNLARVAQFMEIRDRTQLTDFYIRTIRQHIGRTFGQALSDEEKRVLRDASFSELVEKLAWSTQVQKLYENEIHHVLAQLDLPLYLTTNFDNFMLQALRSAGKASARQIGIRWRYDDKSGTSEYALLPAPSHENPVVLHLNGFQDNHEQQKMMVFSEDGYLQQFARITQQRDRIFPANVLGMLAQSSFMLIGFNLQDWEFRLVVQGLLPTIAQAAQKPHVGVQLDQNDEPNHDKVIGYMAKFLEHYNIEVYWGTPQQFANELQSYWQGRPDDKDENDPFAG